MLRVKGTKITALVRQKTTAAAAATANINVTSDDYQYLRASKVPMLHFQASLPRLPIPKLEKTSERYLTALRPLLDDDRYQQTQKVVADFRTSFGPLLNDLLKLYDKSNKHTSFITEPWTEMYLQDRVPLPINYTPFLTFKPDPRPEYNDQLIRTTNLVISSLRFMRSLQAERLAPEVFHLNAKKSDTDTYRTVTRLAPAAIATYVSYAFKAFPLDMSQYQGLFRATRIPEIGKDQIYRATGTRHLLVMRRGHLFSVDVIDEQGNIESPEIILARLKYILSLDLSSADHPLGAMTTENRDVWAKLRTHLIDQGNANALKTIDSALFCLSLDDTVYGENNIVPLVRDGLCSSGINRWFDKSLSLITAKDGTATVIFEHSWGDGVAVLRYFNDVFNDSVKSPFVNAETKPSSHANIEQTIQKLDLNLDVKSKETILNAKKNHESITGNLDIDYVQYYGLNKGACKKFGLSPDSIMQLSFQLAFFKQNQMYVPTYESCSTAIFRHGRTETIRPCTNETKQFCDAVELASTKPNAAQLRTLLDNCSTKHSALTKDAAMGQGFDRHLFALKHMTKMHGHPLPDLYLDPSYSLINHNIISTSTLSSTALLAGGFGPVVKDGYGIAYSIQDEFVGCIVTNYNGQRNGTELCQCLEDTFKEFKRIVEAAPKTQTEKK